MGRNSVLAVRQVERTRFIFIFHIPGAGGRFLLPSSSDCRTGLDWIPFVAGMVFASASLLFAPCFIFALLYSFSFSFSFQHRLQQQQQSLPTRPPCRSAVRVGEGALFSFPFTLHRASSILTITIKAGGTEGEVLGCRGVQGQQSRTVGGQRIDNIERERTRILCTIEEEGYE